MYSLWEEESELQMNYHKQMSYIKSVIRIFGYLTLIFSIFGGAMLLIIAEILGICEEKYE